MKKFQHYFPLFLLFVFLTHLLWGNPVFASPLVQDETALVQANQLLIEMSPEEKVGQLFLISFSGSSAATDSQIFDLIRNYHVGGVMLSGANDNFVASPDTIESAFNLISQLQNAEFAIPNNDNTNLNSETPTFFPSDTPTLTSEQSLYIPLFIGIMQSGDGYPMDQILSGLTPLPDLMAIGATWNANLAERVGAVTGQELSTLGINFFIGPSLDVLDSPETNLGNGLDANVFGGDPYWVGAMGNAYITGLHEGSQGKMVVIANHFPGRGSSDRPVGEEPATVRKSLEQLKQIELAPYFAVTGNAPTTSGTTDGLLVSHIRYQGFQGNIRSTTRPVSLDPQALSQILSLPAFASWRDSGGLVASDDLGSQTVRSFYDSTGQIFQARIVARDAFLAGNDLLYMGNIVSSDATDNYSSVTRSIDFFVQKYLADSAFAQRVDDAVLRILTVKYRLYPTFEPDLVQSPKDDLSQLGKFTDVTFDVARQSATLVSPDILDLESLLPSPPGITDRMVFITDTRSGKQCSTCEDEPMLAVNSLQNAIIRLFGPQAGGLVTSNRLSSFSLDSIAAILTGGAGNSDLEYSLRQSSWIILSILDAEPGLDQTTILKRFLSERQDLIRNKRVIVFAFNAPYFLDATDISKLTAYYCLYSKSSPFIDSAALLLFRELSPAGVLPVSVSGIGYDLLSATSPDPSQVINLYLDMPLNPEPTGTTTPEPTITPYFNINDTISIKTGTILDHNGHYVPDGTGVQFKVITSVDGSVIQQIETTTTLGIAKASFNLARAGLFEVSASSDPAITSVILQLNISTEGLSLTVIAPTQSDQPTSTPQAENSPFNKSSAFPDGRPGFSGWFVMMLIMSGFGSLTYFIGNRLLSFQWTLRYTLCVVLGGLIAYFLLTLPFMGLSTFLVKNGWFGLVITIFIGVGIGFSGSAFWQQVVKRQAKKPE